MLAEGDGTVTEPKIEMVEMYRCPDCGQLFAKREHFDRHAWGCSKAGMFFGRCVKWTERLDAYTAEYRGRVVDVHYSEPDIDPYTLEDLSDPITVVVVGFRTDDREAEMMEYFFEPGELEIVPDYEFEERYICMAMSKAREELGRIRKDAEANMAAAGLIGSAKQGETE